MGVIIPDKPFVLENINSEFLKKNSLLPYSEDTVSVNVLKSEKTSLEALSIIVRQLDKKINFHNYEDSEIQRLIYKWYEAQANVETEGDISDIDALIDDPSQLRDIAQEAPIIRLVNNYINYALTAGASDIHIEPTKKNLDIRYRIDGVLYQQDQLAKKVQPAVISRVKLMARMDIAEVRLPQDGRIKMKFDERDIDIRVSSIPTIFGESLVLRILNKESVELKFESLGMNSHDIMMFKSLITRPYGMVLVTGPTGSGKTTTLYTAINNINRHDKKIITVEDPVEYQFDNVNQIQVNSKIGLTFASALRSILRQDPDIILIGEIRDVETAEIAIQSSLTGHLVFSTLHTNDAPSAIARLVDMGMEPYLIASSLLGVVGQRLVRKICAHCREEVLLSKEEQEAVRASLLIQKDIDISRVFKGTGCSRCANTGYRGRNAVYEIMLMTEDLRREIIRATDTDSLRKAALNSGMFVMKDDGVDKVLKGITTFEELLGVLH